MEQSIPPSTSMILRRIQRIRQYRCHEQPVEVRASGESMFMLLRQRASAQSQGEYVKYEEGPGSVAWKDFDDWHNAPARTWI